MSARSDLPSNIRPKFRAGEGRDVAAIEVFQIAMAQETEDHALDPPTVKLGVAALFKDPSRGLYFVAESEGEVIASLLITTEWSDWRNGPIWWIQSVYVIPAARGRGVFRGLYEFTQAAAIARGDVRGLRLYVEKQNTRAQRVYEKLGMQSHRYAMFEWMRDGF